MRSGTVKEQQNSPPSRATCCCSYAGSKCLKFLCLNISCMGGFNSADDLFVLPENVEEQTANNELTRNELCDLDQEFASSAPAENDRVQCAFDVCAHTTEELPNSQEKPVINTSPEYPDIVSSLYASIISMNASNASYTTFGILPEENSPEVNNNSKASVALNNNCSVDRNNNVTEDVDLSWIPSRNEAIDKNSTLGVSSPSGSASYGALSKWRKLSRFIRCAYTMGEVDLNKT